jgi:hypothetical protein
MTDATRENPLRQYDFSEIARYIKLVDEQIKIPVSKLDIF